MSEMWPDIIRNVNIPFQPSPAQHEYFSDTRTQQQIQALRLHAQQQRRQSDAEYMRNLQYIMGRQWPDVMTAIRRWPEMLDMPKGA